MDIKINIDTKEVFRSLNDIEKNQVPFATSKGLNTLANKIQAEERRMLESSLKLRRSNWILQGVYINPANRATKRKLSVIIEIRDDRSFLNMMETGGTKVSVAGKKYVAIPNQSVFNDKIIRSSDPLRIRNLKLTQAGSTIKGDKGTALVRTPFGAAIIQNMSSGRSKGTNKDTKVRRLYTLKSSVKIPVKIHFIDTAHKVIDKELVSTFNNALTEAMKTAKY